MATKGFVVTGEQYYGLDGQLLEIKRQLRQKGGTPFDPDWLSEQLQNIIEAGQDWIERIVNREKRYHQAFFGRTFDLTSFEQTLRRYGEEQIAFWKSLGLEVHFLPEITMSQNTEFPGWNIKPENWYYQKVAEGKILRDINNELQIVKEVRLKGITVFIDTRLKPSYNDGKQMYENDNLLGDIIEQLRKKKKIAKYEYGPQDSRFGVSANEWQEEIRPFLAERLKLGANQLRLELAIEGNVIPQLYPHMPRKNDGKTNTWVWYEEYRGGRGCRLLGGHSDSGGLSYVRYDDSGDRWHDGSLRPLAVL